MYLGMPGSEEHVTKNLTSPKSEDVNARYSFMTGESAAMDETVDSLAKEGDEAVKTLPPTYSYSRPLSKIQDTTGTKSARHLLQDYEIRLKSCSHRT